MSNANGVVPLRQADLAGARVAVLGLGLMGGSLAAALKRRQACAEVIGVARRPETVSQAVELGYVDRACTDPAQALPDADPLTFNMQERTDESSLPVSKSNSILVQPLVPVNPG